MQDAIRDAVAEGSAATDDVDGAAHRLAAIVDGLSARLALGMVGGAAGHGPRARRAGRRAPARASVPAHASLSDRLRTDLRPFLEPATAVVLGASPRSGVAGQWVRNLTAGGCRVTGTHPVNRELGGVPVVPAIGDLDHVPDIACVALGAGNAVAGVEQALAHGTRHFVVPGLGPETGPEGAAARARLTELCDAYDGLMVGPNCMGVMAPGAPSAWIGTVLPSVRPGCGRDPRPVRLVRRGGGRAWARGSGSAAWSRAATRAPATPPTGWPSTRTTRRRRRSR